MQAKDITDVHSQVGRDGLLEAIQLNLVPIESAPATSWVEALSRAVVSSTELSALTLQPRRKLLGDFFCEGDLGFIYAFRGVGKTWLALGIARALSEGGAIGPWQADEVTKVLYVDGEMPADLMRARDQGLRQDVGEVVFLNHEILFDRTQKVLNITDPEVQQAITGHCLENGIKVVVLDNLSTLASGMKENDSFAWEQVNNWLLQFRRHKIAVIIVHHAGRNGEARGTSKREDAAFWVMALDDAKKHADDKNGARFISRFTKPSRNTQDEVPAYEWHITTEAGTGKIRVNYKLAQSLDVLLRLIKATTYLTQQAGLAFCRLEMLLMMLRVAGANRQVHSIRNHKNYDQFPSDDMQGLLEWKRR